MYTFAQLERLKGFLKGQKIRNAINTAILYAYVTAWGVAIVGVVYVTIKAKLMGI